MTMITVTINQRQIEALTLNRQLTVSWDDAVISDGRGIKIVLATVAADATPGVPNMTGVWTDADCFDRYTDDR